MGLEPCGGCGLCGVLAPLTQLFRAESGLQDLAVEWQFCGRGHFWFAGFSFRDFFEDLAISDFLFMLRVGLSKLFVRNGILAGNANLNHLWTCLTCAKFLFHINSPAVNWCMLAPVKTGAC